MYGKIKIMATFSQITKTNNASNMREYGDTKIISSKNDELEMTRVVRDYVMVVMLNSSNTS
jgi:hypothetical protein